jgi:hypothetical protein
LAVQVAELATVVLHPQMAQHLITVLLEEVVLVVLAMQALVAAAQEFQVVAVQTVVLEEMAHTLAAEALEHLAELAVLVVQAQVEDLLVVLAQELTSAVAEVQDF